MNRETFFLIVADAILLIHVMFVIFVVFGLMLIFVGKVRRWQWVRSPWFRVVHLLAIGVVVVQSWMGVSCPLTVLEMSLRRAAGDAVYDGDFISHWLSAILYFQAPDWVFVALYTSFGALVLASWYWVRPRAFGR